MTHTKQQRGYMKRYIAFSLRHRGTVLLLGLVFLIGVIMGCRIVVGDQGMVGSLLQSLLQPPAADENFLQNMVSAFTTNILLLLFLFVCGFCAISQPMILFVLLFKGLGFGLMGGYLYGLGEKTSVLYYTLVLLPEMLLTITLLIAASKEALGFTKNFLYVLIAPPKAEDCSVLPVQVYCARFVLYFILNGVVAFLIGLIKTSYFSFFA